MVSEIQSDFHAGIPSSDNQNSLVLELLAVFKHDGMKDIPGEATQPSSNLGDKRVGGFPGSHHQEPRRIFLNLIITTMTIISSSTADNPGSHNPRPQIGVEGRGLDGSPVERSDGEAGDVIGEVLSEELLGQVGGEIRREGHVREAAELLSEVKVETVVRVLVPERGVAVFSLEDDVGNAQFR